MKTHHHLESIPSLSIGIAEFQLRIIRMQLLWMPGFW